MTYAAGVGARWRQGLAGTIGAGGGRVEGDGSRLRMFPHGLAADLPEVTATTEANTKVRARLGLG